MCSVCATFEERRIAAGTIAASYGAVAQLVERFHGMEEVAVSSTVSSTDLLALFHRCWRSIGSTLCGLVAGEGSFIVTQATPPRFADGAARKRFVFQVTMAKRDRPALEALRTFLGYGSIGDQWRKPR